MNFKLENQQHFKIICDFKMSIRQEKVKTSEINLNNILFNPINSKFYYSNTQSMQDY